MTNKPNLFIVGAPKCGTTALSKYLGTHPNVFISTPKEPNYFCTDYPHSREFKQLEDYLTIFEPASASHKVIGEASTIYLHSDTAIPLILETFPNAKIIAMVRNPIEMIYSWHSQLVYNGYESEKNFERAWHIQDQREGRFYRYATFGKLGERLEKAVQQVPREQLKIILFDDFKKDTKTIYHEVLSFLELPHDERQIFEKVNENKVARSQFISNFLRDTPAPLVAINSFIKKQLGIKELGLLARVKRLNNKTTKRNPLPAELRQEMAEAFKDDVKLLSTLLNRDLSYWLEKK